MSVAAMLRQFSLMSLAVCLIAGCGEKGYEMTGNVTFDGKPVPAGKIYLIPDDSKGNKGAPGYAKIENGKYDTAALGGKAPSAPGPVVVGIEGFDPAAAGVAAPGDTSGEVTVKALFPYYETTAVIPEDGNTLDFEVPASAANRKSAPERPYINP